MSTPKRTVALNQEKVTVFDLLGPVLPAQMGRAHDNADEQSYGNDYVQGALSLVPDLLDFVQLCELLFKTHTDLSYSYLLYGMNTYA